MLFTIISTAVLVCLSIVLWKSMTTPKAPASRARRGSRPATGPWEAGNNQRRGAP